MQYILDQAEYDALKRQQEHSIKLSKDKLQALCTKIANEMPVAWGNGPADHKPWGCILSDNIGWYCDDCPAQSICPYPYKEWSQ